MISKIMRKIHRAFNQAEASVDVTEVDGVRSLHLGSVTVQSAMRVKDPNALELTYSRGMMCFLLFNTSVKHLLSIGLGGGSVPKYLHAYCPEIVSTVVEINPQIINVARSHFYLPDNDERLNVIEGNGLKYLILHTESADILMPDILMIDAFDQFGIPPDFCSQMFFDNCSEALSDSGILVINLWGSDKKFDVYLQRIEQSFNHQVLILPTGKPGNIVVFGFKKLPIDLRIASLRTKAKELEATHKIEFIQFVEKLKEHNASTSNRLML
ncbi:MAG: polyamine aminopropyltransferase [Methylophilaceae bacterium]|nr:polyamine aminopropyltransferase [Methylophilaceae bacterium]